MDELDQPTQGGERERIAAELRGRYEAGADIRQLVADTGYGYTTVHRLLDEAGTELRRQGRRPHQAARTYADRRGHYPAKVPAKSRSQVQRMTRTGVSYQQLVSWTEKGYLRADPPHPGKGGLRSWSPAERAVAFVMICLRDAGLELPAAHKVARGCRKLAPGVTITVDLTELVEESLRHGARRAGSNGRSGQPRA